MSTTVSLRVRHATRQNAKTWANHFRARILEPGIVSYEEQDAGKNLLQKPCLDQCIHTFVGKPLVLSRSSSGRPTYTHPTKVTERNQDQFAVGYISGVEYDSTDGWWYAVGTVHDDDGKKAAADIGYVSCAFDVTLAGPGGEYHNIPYDLEILAFEGEHLAIVKSPRYETATIRLNAKTKTKPVKHMFKLFQNIKNVLAPKPDASTKQNDVASPTETILAADAALEVDGKPVPVADLVASHQRVNSKDGEAISGDSEIQIGDETVTIDELISFRANAKKKNDDDDSEETPEELKKRNDAEAAEKAEKEKKENDAKKNDEVKPGEKEDCYNRKNSKVIYRVNAKPGVLTNAREAGLEVQTSHRQPETRATKLARGMERYGPKNVTPAPAAK